jgi:hypothetical protein
VITDVTFDMYYTIAIYRDLEWNINIPTFTVDYLSPNDDNNDHDCILRVFILLSNLLTALFAGHMSLSRPMIVSWS